MVKKMNQVLEVISQKKTPTYAEIALKNLPIPQVVITKKPANQPTNQTDNPTTVQKKPARKPREKSVYREKRLILQISKDFIKNLDVIQIRDQVNDAFFKKIVIHTVLIRPFSIDDDLYLLKQKIETFYSGIKLIKIP